MTENSQITKLKKLAKRYARASRISQAKALDFVASELGHKHWGALKAQEHKGWSPTDECIEAVESTVNSFNPFANGSEDDFSGFGGLFGDPNAHKNGAIGGVPYTLFIWQDEVHLEGNGWKVILPEAPCASPIVEIEESLATNSPLNDAETLQKLLKIGEVEAKNIHARIASEWPRRSTKPNARGVVCHPLFGAGESGRLESDTWFCLHCNSRVSGNHIAANLWHCPSCGASPIDIYSTPFWLSENDEAPKPIAAGEERGRGEPIVRTVESRTKLKLDEKNVTLLIRCALLDDATNAGERLGALLADITFDEEIGVWVTFETNYWPEAKEPVQARAVAKALGVGFEEELMLDEPIFAWPGIGNATQTALDYTVAMLRAYEEHGSEKKGE